MDAMILAAGLGTRLGKLTDAVPKALVGVGGRPLLARVMDRLSRAGADRIIVNVHHHAEKIEAFLEEAFLEEMRHKGVEIVLSREPNGPYETGGGLLHARKLFRDSGPFILHNVDVLSEIPLRKVLADHRGATDRKSTDRKSTDRKATDRKATDRKATDRKATEKRGADEVLLASVAVQRRPSRRVLLFDDMGLLGWENRKGEGMETAREEVRDPVGSVVSMAFTGIHIIEPAIFHHTWRSGRFSIITLYLELAAAGFSIRPIDVTGHWWIDVGTPERLAEARTRFS